MILCCGEALIDMLPRKLEDGSDVFFPVAGGAIFNTAIALGRLEKPVGFLCGISNDLFGDQLIDVLKASNVSEDYCVRVDNPTTLAFVRLTDGVAEYSFMDENSALRSLEVSMLSENLTEISTLHIGAISLISEPCGTAYEALVMREKDDKLVSFDPNIRTGFVTDETVYRGRIERLLAVSDIVKVSDEDLDWISPGVGHEAAIGAMLENGASIVLLTKGSDGVDAYTKDKKLSVAAQKVEVVDTIGAGDTFNAGFLSGLSNANCLSKEGVKTINSANLEKAIELGNRVAGITVSRAGANPPWLKELS